MKNLFILFAIAFALVSCKQVDFVDGRVPAEYLALAKKLEGTYKGDFNGIQTELDVFFDGDKPMVNVRNANNNDLLGTKCDSKIGNIKWANVGGDEQNPKIKSVGFLFSPNNCHGILGRTLELAFKEKNGTLKVSAAILYDRVHRRECRYEAPPPYGPGEVCEYKQYDRYLVGSFIR